MDCGQRMEARSRGAYDVFGAHYLHVGPHNMCFSSIPNPNGIPCNPFSSQTGAWKYTAGEYPGEGFEKDKGIQTSEDARFYSLTAPLSSPFDNKDKDLIISYTVKHEQNLDCGGAYIKVSGRFSGRRPDNE